MKLRRLEFTNFRLFQEFNIEFQDENLLVIIGENGSGKTSILDAIALCLTHFTGELISNKKGYNIDSWFKDDDVLIGKKSGKITLHFSYINPINNKFFGDYHNNGIISVSKELNEIGLKFDKQPNDFISFYKKAIENNSLKSIPLIAFYNVNRTYDYSKNDKIETYNEKLFAYEKSLTIDTPNFQYFEDWFIKQEILENSLKVRENNLQYKLNSINNVRTAFSTFMSHFSGNIFNELLVVREIELEAGFKQDVKPHLAIKKNNIITKYKQLSSGERMIISLVCDIARRLSIANENNDYALSGEGVVLIDEVELHLHPRWQKVILSALVKTFPNIQFLVTTHSPLVLSSVRKNSIMLMKNAELVSNADLPNIYSATANEILERLLSTDSSIDDYDQFKSQIDDYFNKGDYKSAKKKLEELKTIINANPKWLADYEKRIDFARS